MGLLFEAAVYGADGLKVAGYLEVDCAAFDGDDLSFFYSRETVVREGAAEGCRVFAPDDDVVGVGMHECFEAVAPAGDVGGDVAAPGHVDDVVDEGVASSSEVP